MLTSETIRANAVLNGLTDEQITAIETLSRNDEDAVIGARFGEVYRQMDTTIENALGIKRNGDEKTYLYLDRAAKEFKGKYDDYDTLKSEVERLKGEVSKGGDDVLKAQIESLTKELGNTKTQFATLKSDYDKEKANHEKALSEYKIDSEIARAIEGIKFKSINETLLETAKAQALANIKSKNPSFEVRDGKERLIFHDENGNPLNNAENRLEPYTAKELLIKEYEAMDLLEKKQSKGAGGVPPTPSQSNSLGATTQVQAHEMIAKMLSDRGISKTSLRYQAEFDKVWEDNKVAELPIQ